MDPELNKTETISAGTEGGKEPDTARRPWKAPVIAHIDMKRTMLQPGSVNDGTTPARV